MNNRLKTLFVLAAGLATSALICQQAYAGPPPLINGSIAFNGTVTLDNGTLSAATKITGYPAEAVAAGEQFGNYSAIPNGFAVAFSTFTFSPPAATVTPLWTLTYSGVTYSLDATSMVSSYDGVANTWTMSGSGIASETGYTDTPGSWNMSINQSGLSLGFTSTAVVPDGGLTLSLLGLALAGIEGLRRKLAK